MAEEFVERNIPPEKDCEDYDTWGLASSRYTWIYKGNSKQSDYPADACTPWYHYNAKINSLSVDTSIIGSATAINVPSASITCTSVSASGNISASSFSGPTISALNAAIGSKKSFDIPHPTKEGWRLRHVCLEGPEAAVYHRGRLTGSNQIALPEYWNGLVDPNTISVTLTQIRTSQDLIVDKVEGTSSIRIKSGNASHIDCYFIVYGERIDGEKLIVEYEGNTYPGDNSQYSLNR